MRRRRAPSHALPPLPPAEDAWHYLLLLDDLSTMGVAIAKEAAETCKGRATTVDHIAETVACYCRASRAVRRAIMLSRRIDAPGLTMDEVHRLFVRKRIVREVEAAIAAARYRPVDAAFLRDELEARLDSEEIDSAVMHLPVSEIIAAICRDLGIAMALLQQPPAPRAPQELSALCLVAAGLPAPVAPSDAGADVVALHPPPAPQT